MFSIVMQSIMMNILLPYPFVCNKIITNNGNKQKWKQKNQQIMEFFQAFIFLQWNECWKIHLSATNPSIITSFRFCIKFLQVCPLSTQKKTKSMSRVHWWRLYDPFISNMALYHLQRYFNYYFQFRNFIMY
jgi:hypothetical protein